MAEYRLTDPLAGLRAGYRAQGTGTMDPSLLTAQSQTMAAPSPQMATPIPSGGMSSGMGFPTIGQQTTTTAPSPASTPGAIPGNLLQGSINPKPDLAGGPPTQILSGGGGQDPAAGIQPGGRGVSLRPLGQRNYPQESAALAQLRRVY